MEASRSDATSGSTPETRPYQLQYEPAQESYCPLPYLLRANVTACTELLHLQPLTYLGQPRQHVEPRPDYLMKSPLQHHIDHRNGSRTNIAKRRF